MSFAHSERISVQEIDGMLRERVVELVEHFRGSPNTKMSSNKEVRFGSKGGLSVEIAGLARGRITDFTNEGAGKSPLQFIREELNLTKGEGVGWAKRFLGLDGDIPMPLQPKPKPKPVALAAPSSDTLKYARRIWGEAEPITGTHAERYLREHRGIMGPLPTEVRYHCSVKSTETGQYHPVFVVAALDDA